MPLKTTVLYLLPWHEEGCLLDEDILDAGTRDDQVLIWLGDVIPMQC